MFKNKYVGLALSFALLVGVVGGGVVLRQHSQSKNNQIGKDTSVAGDISSDEPLTQPQSVDSVPLNQTQPQTNSSSGGLSVAPDNMSFDLGQSGQGAGGNPAQGQTNTSSSRTSPIDPKSFTQYDKYINEKNALFGEVQKGTGPELTADKKAAVFYRGWLTNGQIFDQSKPDEKGQMQPFVFTLGAHQVIPGWEQALAGMKVGGTRLIIVPPAAGYGNQAQGSIPANSVLVFQVELAAVQ